MSDRYYATLTIRQKEYARPDVREAVLAYFGHPDPEASLPVEDETPDLITFSDEFARNGRFEGLEEALVQMGVPFERHSSAYDEYTAETRYFRPEAPDREHRDKTVCEVDGEPFVVWSELKQAAEAGIEAVWQLLRAREAPRSLFDAPTATWA